MKYVFACLLAGWNISLGQIQLGVHLFVDSQFLSSSSNLSFGTGDIVKEYSSPAVTPSQLWDKHIQFYSSATTCPPSISACNGGYFAVMYACSGGNQLQPATLCVAQSVDAITWTKPTLPYFVWNGTAVVPSSSVLMGAPLTNAVFQTNETASTPGSIVLDDGADVQDSERFKLTYEGAGGDRLLFIASAPSPTGPWSKRTPEDPIVPLPLGRLFSDTQTAMVVDPLAGTWTAYGRRDWTYDSNVSECEGGLPSLRRVMAVVSNTSAAGPYSDPVEILTPGAPDVSGCLDNYNSAPMVIHGVTFLLSSNFWHFSANESGATGSNRDNDGIQDVRLLFSRAEAPLNVSYVSREPFIRRGMGWRDPTSGAFNVDGSDLDAGFVFATAGGMLDLDLLTPNSTRPWPFRFASPSPIVHLLYWGGQVTHASSEDGAVPAFAGILRARMRREGYARLETSATDVWSLGSLTTLPLTFPAQQCSGAKKELWMLLNAETSVGGYISIELQDANTGAPIPGFTFADFVTVKGNYIRAPIGWLSNNTGAELGRKWSDALHDPPVPPPTTYDLSIPSQGGTRPIVLAMQVKHARLYAWDLQCV